MQAAVCGGKHGAAYMGTQGLTRVIRCAWADRGLLESGRPLHRDAQTSRLELAARSEELMRTTTLLFTVILALPAVGCTSEDIPEAYRGRMFGRTRSRLAFYSGRTGFYGPVLGPGTYFTGTYDEIHKVECSTMTVREPLNALTKDGVQFGLNVYVRFSPDCSDAGVTSLLSALPVDEARDVTAGIVYRTYVQPAVGEATREVVSPVKANDVNDQREEILASIRKRFLDIVAQREKHFATIYEVNLSNLDFPDDMDRANTERAIQGILRDKAIAERQARVTAEIKTMGDAARYSPSGRARWRQRGSSKSARR